ncbi:long-chain fatty acid--CoA ligase [Sphingobium sp. SCG-1]|uniref:long-chain-fatty-acid--CoA ligase n=1 Tax=Sphingobium sp. SCG-1 TaxID=2072936 RepID=UPI000CD68510|nr:long-chain-fatty-acid--CoA ligase [Sphingobium sp. SCG-1]AUW56986.1 long-chain fatty acid--CoA ligase [Sphingobium sp. SCG-1]
MPLRFAEPAKEVYQYPLTIRHLLDGVLTRAADQQIVYRDQASFTYRDLVERIGRLASLLKDVGGDQGMTVAVMDWDSHRYLEAYFAIPMMGAVLQTVNVRMPPPQIAYTLQHARAEILLVHRDFFPIIEAIRPALPELKAIIAITDGTEDDVPAWGCGEYEALSASASPDFPFEDFDENALATTFYTTGTTGNPKGVCFTHRQLVIHTLAAAGAFGASLASPGIGVGDVYMPLTPMFHVHAWGVPYIATMLGVKQVYPGRYEAAMICRLRSEHATSYSHCVPTILEMVLQGADQAGTDLSGWKITIGGSALTKSLCAQGRSRGMLIGAGYGMSETCPMISKAALRFPEQTADENAALAALTSSGIPTPLVSVRIVDEAMNDVPQDGHSRGELVLRAPWLTPCYTGDAEASEALWRGGWLHTQDIATIDGQGHVQIRDRLKDVIKTGGEWIDSIQLEELVATTDGIIEASVVAVPDAKWGERPLAVVVPAHGVTPTLDMLNATIERAIAAGAITRYAKLDRFEIVDQLPRTTVGKIDKKVLRARYSDAAEAQR